MNTLKSQTLQKKTHKMSSSFLLRHLRHLCTTAVGAAAPTATSGGAASTISISRVKLKLLTSYDPDEVLEIYSSVSDDLSTSSSRFEVLDLTIKRLAQSGRFSDIETLIEPRKNDPKITQEPYLSTIIRSYGRAGMFDHAMRTYDQMEDLGTPRSVVSFNALLAACNYSRLFDKVPNLFDEIPKRNGFSPDKISYGILVKAYCEMGSIEEALETLSEMEKTGIEVTVVTFTVVFNALHKNGMREQAEQLWSKMVKDGCELDVSAYNVRIMYDHGGEAENVKALIDEMSNAGLKPNVISYNYLITCYCIGGMVEEAMKVYEGLKENGCRPNADTFRTLIWYLCRKGDHEKAYRVFKESVRLRKIPHFDTVKCLAEGLVEKKKMKDAKGLSRTMKKYLPNSLLNEWKNVEEKLGLASSTALVM